MINVYKHIIDVAESVLLVSFPWLHKLPTARNRKFHRLVKEFNEFIFDIIEKKRKEIHNNKDADYKDLLSNMLKSSEIDGVYYDNKNLRDEMATFFIAGHDSKFESNFIRFIYLKIF